MTVPITVRFLPSALVLGTLAPVGSAQSVLHAFAGDSYGHLFGVSVSGAGDVDGDGVPDLIVGASRDDYGGPGSGSAVVFSGKDGAVLHTFRGGAPGHFLGGSVSGAGDVNADGHDDLIVGAVGDDDNGPWTGSAYVHSGKDGTLLYEFTGNSEEDYFGFSVSGAGDANGDGFADLIVGAPWEELGAIGVVTGERTENTGIAYVYSGADGSLLYRLLGHSGKKVFGSNYHYFGFSVSGAGDVDGDGLDDVVVGAPFYSTPQVTYGGCVRVFSGADGGLLHVLKGDGDGYCLGNSVSAAGDVDGDGFDDLIAGGLTVNYLESRRGMARVWSGLDGSVLHTFFGDTPYDYLGYSVGGAGDVNGDGFDDFIVGAPYDKWKDRGSAQVISGRDGTVLQLHVGAAADDYLGGAVAGAGDVNGDGFADVIVGAGFGDTVNGQDTGAAWVFSGCDALGTPYCSPAVSNSTGVPGVITACGSPQADGGYFMLRASDLPTDQFGYFLVSAAPGFVANPGGSQGNLCLGGAIGRFRQQIQDSGSAGSFTIQVDLGSLPTNPPHAVLPGETWSFQAWYRDVNPVPTSNFTDAVSLTFQ